MNKKQEKALSRMHVAVGKWVEAMGGTALIAGDVQVQKADRPINFYVAVKITGRWPAPKEAK